MRSLTLTALVAITAAQSSYNIDPKSVSDADRSKWCLDQTSSCPLICTQVTPGASAATVQNSCNSATLTWQCVCAGNIQPNISQYSLTVPYWECVTFGNQCVKNCGNFDSSCAASCRDNNPCGAQSPNLANTTTSTSSSASSTGTSSPTSSSLSTFGGAGSNTGGSNGNSAANSILHAGQFYGIGMIAAGFIAGFSYLL